MVTMYYFWYEHYHSNFWTAGKYISYTFIWITFVPVSPGIKEDRPRYGAQKTTCCIGVVRFLTWNMNFVKESSSIRGCMKHYGPQHNTEAPQRCWRWEVTCQASKRGARPPAVPRHSCVTKSNLSAESKPVQCALLQYLCFPVTPHEYLMLGEEEGRRKKYCIDSYTAVCVYHWYITTSLPNCLSGSYYCVQL